jgi:copper homeostasis protein
MLEIIVETVADARAAEAGGATQLDLKCDFVEYGLTPSIGMVEQVSSEVDIDVLMMTRPYANGMVLSHDDLNVMCTDLHVAAKHGADGFLLGALTEKGGIDTEAIQILQEAAGEIPLHFHLAWEMTVDPQQALEELIELGIKSIRTSGGQGLGGKAPQGIEGLKRYQEQAQDRIDMFLAGGINRQNIGRLVRKTGIPHAHAGTSVRTPPNQKGSVTESKVRQLRKALDEAVASLAE